MPGMESCVSVWLCGPWDFKSNSIRSGESCTALRPRDHSGADLRKYRVHDVEGVWRGEDFLKLVFECAFGGERDRVVQIPHDQRIEVNAVGEGEQFEFVAERGSSNIEVVDEQVASSLSYNFALHQLTGLLAQ